MRSKSFLIVIAGPTAVGKSNFAYLLAKELNCHIVSADSRQIYRELNIGTAKPDEDVLRDIQHYFVNNISIEESYNAGIYEKQAMEIITDYFKNKAVLILTGGSGLYIKAICEGFDKFSKVPPQLRSDYQMILEKTGIQSLQKMLRKVDPEYYQEVDIHNPTRLIRALSVIETTGKKFSQLRLGNKKTRPFKIRSILLTLPREKLYEKINKRVDQMMRKGLLEEVRSLYEFRHLQGLQTLAYQEIIAHLDGKLSLVETVDLIKRNTRRYAKRQMTWFRKYGAWKEFRSDDPQALAKVLEYIKEETISP